MNPEQARKELAEIAKRITVKTLPIKPTQKPRIYKKHFATSLLAEQYLNAIKRNHPGSSFYRTPRGEYGDYEFLIKDKGEEMIKDRFDEQMQAMITKYQKEMQKLPSNSVEYLDLVEKIKNLEHNLENFIAAKESANPDYIKGMEKGLLHNKMLHKDNDATENGSIEQYGQNKETEKMEPSKNPVQAQDEDPQKIEAIIKKLEKELKEGKYVDMNYLAGVKRALEIAKQERNMKDAFDMLSLCGITQ